MRQELLDQINNPFSTLWFVLLVLANATPYVVIIYTLAKVRADAARLGALLTDDGDDGDDEGAQ